MTEQLRVPALEITQSPGRVIYSFAVDGKRVAEFAAVSRLGRDEAGAVVGYQRPEVLSHVAEIRSYLESERPMIPNALVLAFDPVTRFEPSGEAEPESPIRVGVLVVPLPASGERKPAWVVDGQQRLAAIRDARIESFPICAVGFVAANDREQREQFILVNSSKPLPKGLVYELLPATDTHLPTMLDRRRFPTLLLDRLNRDSDSPLKGLIRTPTVSGGVVKDTSLLKALENSLSDGVLYRYRRSAGGDSDPEAMLDLLKHFWCAVKETFPDAWGLPPRRSRLMHGAGVIGLGFLMDAIADRTRDVVGAPTREQFQADLEQLRGVCRWTEGYWDFGPGLQRKWNEIQNTPKDIQVLSNYLLIEYRSRVWSKVETGQDLEG